MSDNHVLPEMIAGENYWPSIQTAVPQTFGEAVAIWGEDVIRCEPHEWDNRTTAENVIWLVCRLHVRKCLERIKAISAEP